MRFPMRYAPLVGLLTVLGACHVNHSESKAEAGDCTSGMWPRLIVELVAPPGMTADPAKLASVRVELADGMVLDGIVRGCPDIAGITCTYSFFTAPKDRTAILIVEHAGQSASREIALGEFNYAGRDITYLTVRLAERQPPKIEAARLINPCAASVNDPLAPKTNGKGTPSAELIGAP
jgi:hypothetical protein